MKLLPSFFHVVLQWRRAFRDHRSHKRALGFALAFLVCLGRRTISRAIWAQGRQFKAWASDYRLFSHNPWDPRALFDAVIDEAHPLMWNKQPLVVALDDTPCRKTGKRIPHAKTLRDPLSPAFNTNLIWALRFLHAVLLLWPAQARGAARGIPIAFELAPPAAKPKPPRKPGGKKKNARQSKAAMKEYKRALRGYKKALKEYRQRRREEGLSAQGAKLLGYLRERFDRIVALRDKILWAVVDASFCNRTVFRKLPKRTVLIGRTRKDIRLYKPVKDTKRGKGRKRRYGAALPTPEELRKDQSVPWNRCQIFAAGKKHNLRYKSIAPVLWRTGAGSWPMRLIVVAPLRYRVHGHTLYRMPAYLLVSDLEINVTEALQAYFYRWEIEADQKEEKDLLGVGQAQVWSEGSVARQPAFHVASYAALLVAAIKTYGLNTTGAIGPLPLWREHKPPTRMSAGQLIARLRQEIELYEAEPKRKHLRKSPGTRSQFQADALAQQIGMKLPVSIRALLDSAWT